MEIWVGVGINEPKKKGKYKIWEPKKADGLTQSIILRGVLGMRGR